jgi:hypothetical protein
VIKIHHNVPIDPIKGRGNQMSPFAREVLRLFKAGNIKVGDMIEAPYDCSNLINRLSDLNIQICRQLNNQTNQYRIWRVL